MLFLLRYTYPSKDRQSFLKTLLVTINLFLLNLYYLMICIGLSVTLCVIHKYTQNRLCFENYHWQCMWSQMFVSFALFLTISDKISAKLRLIKILREFWIFWKFWLFGNIQINCAVIIDNKWYLKFSSVSLFLCNRFWEKRKF